MLNNSKIINQIYQKICEFSKNISLVILSIIYSIILFVP